MAMDKIKDMGFGKSDAQIAKAFGMSTSDFKKAKKQLASDISKPKVTAKPAVTAKPKPVVKPTTKAAPKPKLNPSEKAFIAGQKKKSDITKKTGVYPNTAN